MLPERLRLVSAAREQLVAAARRERPVDLLLEGGILCDVYTGSSYPADVGIARGRVAFVDRAGDDLPRPAVQRLDVDGRWLLPAFVEPHGHGDLVCTPDTVAARMAAAGTGVVVFELLSLLTQLEDDDVAAVLEAARTWQAKVLWSARPCLDGFHARLEQERLPAERLVRLLDRYPEVTGIGELTSWPALLAGDERLGAVRDAAVDRGLRVDGHAPGASATTLAALACAGMTSDHEATDGEEVLERLRLGYWTMLRHSSLRRDAGAIGAAIAGRVAGASRLMLTTDGPVAADLAGGGGSSIAAVRALVSAGWDLVDAVRAASLNPATYLGLDAHVGGVAPGRCADLVLCADEVGLEVTDVVLDGRVVDMGAPHPAFPWAQLAPSTSLRRAKSLDAASLCAICDRGPIVEFDGIVTRATSAEDGRDITSNAALVSRDGTWATGMRLSGPAPRSFASTFTGGGDVLLVGADPDALVASYRDVVHRGGGLAAGDFVFDLDVAGVMSSAGIDRIAAATAVLQERCFPGDVPVEFLSLFLSMGVLPELRLTEAGVVEVKTGRVAVPPVRLDAPPLEPARAGVSVQEGAQ